ncbi:MAG: nitrile hydratase accessory protein [Alphaproteobacteria bacterium]|nr:nitrile hydratase accessory protein [Alphaproteobacteria bacterium]TAD90086.1 MAG: nitrile hydratase accessory protein [Alphaproteobacteria bacterium]
MSEAALTRFRTLIAERDGPVFAAPWEARAFALAIAAHEAGLFTWTDWAATLGEVIADAGASDTGDQYYRHWLTALERLTDAAAKP